MVSDFKQLGAQIQKLRRRAGLTQDDLSDKAGLAYSTLAKIERGAIKNPSVFTVAAVAKALNVQIEELMSESVSAKPLKSQTSPVKFLYVDLNGVIVRFYQRAFMRLSKKTGVPIDKIETTFWHYNDAANRGDMSTAEFSEAMAQHLHIAKFNWQDYYLDAVEPIAETQKLLVELQGKVRLGILSNTMPGLIDELKKRGYIPNIKYDVVIDSSVVKAIKPELKIYEIAEKMAGCQGQDIFFVDDSRTNLMAAERCNWRVLWFDDFRPEESVSRIKESLAL
jgi:HAD superfamily hydrolase (TIGR01509 family)